MRPPVWTEIKSDQQASLFYNLGARKLRFGKHDTRERTLYIYSGGAMSIDDSGGSCLKSFYRTEDPPEVLLSPDAFSKLYKGK